MMRLGRMASLLALALLTSAATAHGESAWVLWRTSARRIRRRVTAAEHETSIAMER